MKKLFLNGSPKNIGFDINGQKKEEALERYNLIKKILEEDSSSDKTSQLDYLILNAIEYISCVVDFETRVQMLRRNYGDSSEIYRNSIKVLDRNRVLKHDYLVSQVLSFNIYLGREYKFNPEGPIPNGSIISSEYTEITIKRIIANWSWNLVSGLYEIVEK